MSCSASLALARSTNPADTCCPVSIPTSCAARSVGTLPKAVNATAAVFSTGPNPIPLTGPPVGGRAVVIAVQAQMSTGGCPPELPEAERVTAVKSDRDVWLDWRPSAAAGDGYNVWRVERKQDIPLAADPPGAGVTGVCTTTQDAFCVDPDATDGRPVYNRTMPLRDSWAKLEQAQKGR